MRFMCYSFVLLFAFVVAPATFAQNEAANDGTAAVADESFDSVFKQLKEIETEINEIVTQIRAAEPKDRGPLIEQYQAITSKLQGMLPKLRTAAVKAYTDAPNQSKDVVEVLVGLLASDVRADKYQSALGIANMLLENKCEAEALNNYAGTANFCVQNFEAAKKQLEQAKADGTLDRQAAQYLASVDTEQVKWKNELAIREKEAKEDDLPRVRMTTSKGDITIELFENQAPQTVGNFVSLVESKFYDGLTFHRVLPGFMAQGGCPNGTGGGGPGYDIYCECDSDDYRKHFQGTLSMAHAGKNTGGSQFFLTFRPTPHLDGVHTAFGRVIEGMDVLADLQRIDPRRGGVEPDKILKAVVVRKRDHEYKPTKVEK